LTRTTAMSEERPDVSVEEAIIPTLGNDQGDHGGLPGQDESSAPHHHTGVLDKIKHAFDPGNISGSGEHTNHKSNYETVAGHDHEDYGRPPPVVDHNAPVVDHTHDHHLHRDGSVEEPHKHNGLFDKIKHAFEPGHKSTYEDVTGANDLADYGRPAAVVDTKEEEPIA